MALMGVFNYFSNLILHPGWLVFPHEHDSSYIFPEDGYALLYWTAAWAIAHQVVVRFFLVPLSKAVVPNKPPAQPAAPVETVADGQTSAIEPSSSENLKNRKQTITSNGHATQSNGAVAKPKKGGPKKLGQMSDRAKFVVSGWKFFTYTVSTAIGLWIILSEDWLLDPPKYFEGWPHKGNMTYRSKAFYSVGFGNYAYASLSLAFEPRQKDFLLMIVHHAVTLALIYFSYLWGFYRIGCAVLLLHDLSDPIMELAKMFLYATHKKMADILFATFAVVFIITRNWIYPYYVIGSILTYGFLEKDGKLIPIPEDGPGIRASAIFGMTVLEILHVYWAFLIVKMAKKAIVDKGVGDDTRNEDD
ncbi:Ceramide synthase 3 [Rhizophlyctis rosea]|uniref:Ceramide synthase 3 n=1 Tax=Rhizophlyctis rosea TaxID=64517 RepID=A0AAD5S5M3_9FUNG|nr:Ceramide synthase 3 [Rhizophlyctis rosea]